MIVRAILGAAFCAASVGCTHHQLARSTALSTGTVMDIQYRTVLMNVALLSCHPEALPSHIDLADGVVQVSDEASFGTGGGFTTAGTPFGLDQSGPAGSRQVSEQWGTDAVTDPRQVTALQDLYRAALGLPPLPPPNAIAYLRRAEAEKGRQGGGDKGGSTPSSGSGSSGGDREQPVPIELLLSDVPPRGGSTLAAKRTSRRTPATSAGTGTATPG